MSEQCTRAEDRVAPLVQVALGRARLVEREIIDIVVPAFFPSHHNPNRVAKILRGQSLFNSSALHDLESLVAQIESEVSKKTHQFCEPAEFEGGEGRIVTTMSEDCRKLAGAGEKLGELRRDIAAVLDAVAAVRIAAKLLAES